MTTEKKKREKFDYKSAPKPEVQNELRQFIADSELRWWINSFPKHEIKDILVRNSFFTKISGKDLNVLLWHHCDVYMHWKRKPESKSNLLASESWDKLRLVIESLRPRLAGLSLKSACVVIRSKISTNEAQLSGLPARLRYWEHQT